MQTTEKKNVFSLYVIQSRDLHQNSLKEVSLTPELNLMDTYLVPTRRVRRRG